MRRNCWSSPSGLRNAWARLAAILSAAILSAAILVVPADSGAEPREVYEEFVVVGEVLKPEITVVISRENLNKAYELKLDESFLDKIVKSVERAPF